VLYVLCYMLYVICFMVYVLYAVVTGTLYTDMLYVTIYTYSNVIHKYEVYLLYMRWSRVHCVVLYCIYIVFIKYYIRINPTHYTVYECLFIVCCMLYVICNMFYGICHMVYGI
jgi:hypothetical protein